MMKTRNLLFLMLAPLVFIGCDSDDPEPVNEEELITTLIYELTPVGGGSTVTLTFRDLDGDGGDAPVITTEKLAANTSYTGSLTLLNESETPAEDITEEIEEEDEEHQFFFAIVTTDATITYADEDPNGNPIGLATNLGAGAVSTGTLTIVLRHEPDKDAAGVSDGDITNAGGETDIEVTFDLVIE